MRSYFLCFIQSGRGIQGSPKTIVSMDYLSFAIELMFLSARAFYEQNGCELVRHLPANAGDTRLIPGSGTSPGEGHGNPLLYSCLGNPMNRGAWWATVHWVTKELDTTYWLKQEDRKLGNEDSFIESSFIIYYSFIIHLFIYLYVFSHI